MTTTRKVIVVVAILVVIQFTVYWIRAGYTMEEIVPPKRDLTQFPLHVGPWVGENVEPDETINIRIGALACIDRKYTNPTGRQVFLHSVWTEDYVRIHYPQVCYAGAGWSQAASKTVTVEVSNAEPIKAQLVTFQRDNAQVYVLYWFQMGDRLFLDRVQHSALRRELCWFQKRWPPLVKVMLQTSATNPYEAEALLREFASNTYAWINARDGEQTTPSPKG